MHTMKNKYELPLLYTSSVPIIMLSALIHNIFIFLLWVARIVPTAAGAIGETMVVGSRVVPLSGILRLVSPPSSVADIVLSPVHTVFYAVFVGASKILTSMRLFLYKLDQILQAESKISGPKNKIVGLLCNRLQKLFHLGCPKKLHSKGEFSGRPFAGPAIGGR
jgi:hypothetical protein